MYMHVLMCMHNQFGDVKKGGRKINEENEKEEEIKSNLSASLFSPPKATTVLMADRTSSATDPAAAYALCSLAVNDATIWRQDEVSLLQNQRSTIR
jgi:hypothetical protein